MSDVDETVADVYRPATREMIKELNALLAERKVLFLISGGGLSSIRERITDRLDKELRHRVLVAHCMGAEVWGFEADGRLKEAPYYGIYDTLLDDDGKTRWREVVAGTVKRFGLSTYDTQPKEDFRALTRRAPLSIMLADRGPQITLEFVNAVDLSESEKRRIEKELGINIPLFHDAYDLRPVVMDFLREEYRREGLPIAPKLGGTCALDSILSGVDKTRAIEFVLSHDSILKQLDIDREAISEADEIEIWGDKYAQKKGGPDFDMCRAVSRKVRALDFRREDPHDLPQGYNIRLWDGEKELHHGLLEYLSSR